MISIIVPYYNTPIEYFDRCIESILNQTYKNFELIIVDDGSSEEYRASLEQIKKLDKRIRLLHKENGGVSSARNLGLRAARGEYITFVDADDEVLPWFLGNAINAMLSHDTDFVIGKLLNVTAPQKMQEISKYIEKIFLPAAKKQLICAVMRPRMKFGNNGGKILNGPYSRLVKTELAKTIPFKEDLSIGEDLIWNLEILYKSYCPCFVDDIWYLYYLHPFSAMHKYSRYALQELEKKHAWTLKLIDLNDDELFLAFGERLLGSIGIVCDICLFHPDSDLSSRDRKYVKARLASNYPWILAQTYRFFRLAGFREKLIWLLLKLHLYFPVRKLWAWFKRRKYTESL